MMCLGIKKIKVSLTMRNIPDNPEDYDNGCPPRGNKKKKKEFVIERRYIGSPRIFELMRCMDMYEKKIQWHRYRAYTKFSDAEKALKNIKERRYEFRLKGKEDDDGSGD
jgi:hypothetical protein